MSRRPPAVDSPELLLARAFASQVRRWLDALEAGSGAPRLSAADRQRVVAIAEAVALATSSGHVCLDLAGVDAADPATLRQVLAAARAALGAEPDVDHPRQPLEPFFLHVVQTAARDGAASGAVPAAPLAPFLQK